jgi:hypothetical protein
MWHLFFKFLRLFISEGTLSWLFGCHSIIHSWYVIKAWKILYKEWPCFWEIVCILIHDIGYCGKNYITNNSNAGHAELGAKIALNFFGDKGWLLVLGHSRTSALKYDIPLSKLEAPDDYSWLIASSWWLKSNHIVEPFKCSWDEWVEVVRKNWENGKDQRIGGFDLYKQIQRN